ncbi:MAG: transglutaminase family protein, partial [Pseudomonadota bacterium]
QDFSAVLSDLSDHFRVHFDPAWFDAQLSFRFPLAGTVDIAGAHVELRNAIEPWPTLGEEGAVGGTTRFVDSSMERLQLRITNLPDSAVPTVNGIEIPLQDTGEGLIAGIKFRAWWPAHCLHPTIQPHAPLTFDFVDLRTRHSLGGCTYHVAHEGGRAHETRPINDLEAEGRRLARFTQFHTPGQINIRRLPDSDEFPCTLDLRRL